MAPFLDQLRSALHACGAIGAPVLVAVSGGADSVALLRGLIELSADCGLRLTAAHLDHGLRGEQSRADAEWVAALCADLHVACTLGREDVAAFARSESIGLEDAGRRVRYRFLLAEAERAACPFVATAHTADDQAETILHHIVRGTGLAGLRGMRRRRPLSAGWAVPTTTSQAPPAATEQVSAGTTGQAPVGTAHPARIELIRPLLDVRRSDARAWLAEIGQPFREDPTNIDNRFTRTRIRHTLVPLLEREFNPDALAAVLRLGRQAAEADDTVSSFARRLLERSLLDQTATTARLDCRSLAGEPRALVREAFRHLWTDLDWPRQAMGYTEWDRLAELVITPGASATLPGAVRAVRRGELLVLSRDVRPG